MLEHAVNKMLLNTMASWLNVGFVIITPIALFTDTSYGLECLSALTSIYLTFFILDTFKPMAYGLFPNLKMT
jgi:hypothetical protein